MHICIMRYIDLSSALVFTDADSYNYQNFIWSDRLAQVLDLIPPSCCSDPSTLLRYIWEKSITITFFKEACSAGLTWYDFPVLPARPARLWIVQK